MPEHIDSERAVENLNLLHEILLGWLVRNIKNDKQEVNEESAIIVIGHLLGQTSVQSFLTSWFPENWEHIEPLFLEVLDKRIASICVNQLTIACCRINDILEVVKKSMLRSY